VFVIKDPSGRPVTVLDQFTAGLAAPDHSHVPGFTSIHTVVNDAFIVRVVVPVIEVPVGVGLLVHELGH